MKKLLKTLTRLLCVVLCGLLVCQTLPMETLATYLVDLSGMLRQ